MQGRKKKKKHLQHENTHMIPKNNKNRECGRKDMLTSQTFNNFPAQIQYANLQEFAPHLHMLIWH